MRASTRAPARTASGTLALVATNAAAGPGATSTRTSAPRNRTTPARTSATSSRNRRGGGPPGRKLKKPKNQGASLVAATGDNRPEARMRPNGSRTASSAGKTPRSTGDRGEDRRGGGGP